MGLGFRGEDRRIRFWLRMLAPGFGLCSDLGFGSPVLTGSKKGIKEYIIWVVVKIDGPPLDPYYNTAPNIFGTQKRTIILTSTYVGLGFRRGLN